MGIYEQVLHVPYYGIYQADPGRIEMHRLVDGHYQQLTPSARGRFPIVPLGVELGVWTGTYLGATLPWMRWFDLDGNMLLTGHESAAREHERAESLAARLRALGEDPDKS